MELKDKVRKIRDLFVYNTHIVPVEIVVKRHKIIITLDASKINDRHYEEVMPGTIEKLQEVMEREIIIDLIKQE